MITDDDIDDARRYYILYTLDNITKQFGIIVSSDSNRIEYWQKSTRLNNRISELFYAGSKRAANRTKQIMFNCLLNAGYTPIPKEKDNDIIN